MNMNIKSAVNGHKNCHFRPMTLTSLDFGRFQPIQYIEMIPGDNFTNIHASGLIRVEPQIFPPFGRLSVKHATFFVPDYQLVNNASAFHSGKTTYQGVSTALPKILNYWLNALFHVNAQGTNPVAEEVVSNPSNSTVDVTSRRVKVDGKWLPYDFAYTYQSLYEGATGLQSGLRFYRMTPLGKKIFALFRGLGYDFAQYRCKESGITPASFSDYIAEESFFISAMPLCAYLKIYCDYFVSGQMYDTSRLVQLSRAIFDRKDYYVGAVSAPNRVFNGSTMEFEIRDNWMQLIRELRVLFEDNLYTTAWNKPNSPLETLSVPSELNLGGIISPISSDGTYEGLPENANSRFGNINTLRNNSTGVYHSSRLSTAQTAGNNSYSALGHKALMAFDAYVRRRNLVGNNVVKQIYSIFGVTPSDKQFLMCSRLDTGQSSIRFNAITSQSDTYNESSDSGAVLGQFAGVGMGTIDINTKFRSDTFGQLITLCWLNIDPIIERGTHPHCLRVSPNDYYNPEWDNNAIRPIPMQEIAAASAYPSQSNINKSIYGYTAIYDDYRNMRDIVCGNFLDESGRHFAFMRDLTRIATLPQASNTQYYEPFGASKDLTNPFIHDSSSEDRFYCGIEWQIDCTRPVQDNDALNIAKGDLSLTKNGTGLA